MKEPMRSPNIKIQAIAAYGGVEIKIGQPYIHHETNKTPEFLAKFPVGKVPAFETSEGAHIFEAIAISGYIAGLAKDAKLLGSSLGDAALINQWVTYMALEVTAPMWSDFYLIHHALPYNKATDMFYRGKVATGVNIIEKHLHTRTYFVGERITLADIYIAADLKLLFGSLGDAQFRSKIPNTLRFFNTIANQPKIKPIFGDVLFIEESIHFIPLAKPTKEKASERASS
ncbi:hypothetical protein FRB96_005536 [Tulasnella sp. 330]|nr:hypothetical protein FRB96_005536 [Tulasnella sp. 330]KAG8879384.1 hypothetical protein FRB97_001655 [Tulasnella sp. 331]KAG8887893.1 hypothetical protein FRB98_008788 [Tulasnella sp. 332]